MKVIKRVMLVKRVTVLVFSDELCQVFNGLMTAVSLLRSGAEVTVFFGSRGINVVHRERIKELKCLPDQSEEVQREMMRRMEELALPTPEDMLTMLEMEGALLLACPLNKELFGFRDEELVEGVRVADPESFYRDVVMVSDFVLSF